MYNLFLEFPELPLNPHWYQEAQYNHRFTLLDCNFYLAEVALWDESKNDDYIVIYDFASDKVGIKQLPYSIQGNMQAAKNMVEQHFSRFLKLKAFT